MNVLGRDLMCEMGSIVTCTGQGIQVSKGTMTNVMLGHGELEYCYSWDLVTISIMLLLHSVLL